MARLSPEEQALWDKVTATIRPLSRNPETRLAPAPDTAVQTTPPETPRPRGRVPIPRPQRPPAPRPRPLNRHGLDSHWERRIKSGTIQPDRVLDLHGHNLDDAWNAIDRGLEEAVDTGQRVILLITGHVRQGEPPVTRGKIRAAVNDWLAASRHSDRIAAVRGAHRRHGGGGSLYIIMRR